MKYRDRCPKGHDNSLGCPEQRNLDGKCRECLREPPYKRERAAYMREYRARTRSTGGGRVASQTPGEWQAAATAASAGLARKLGVDPDCAEWAAVTEALIVRVLHLGGRLAVRAWLEGHQAQTGAAPGLTVEARETVEAYRAGATRPAMLAEVLGIENEAARQRIRRYKKRELLGALVDAANADPPEAPRSPTPRSAPRSYLNGAYAPKPTRVEKLQLMAAQSASPVEAAIARQKLEAQL